MKYPPEKILRGILKTTAVAILPSCMLSFAAIFLTDSPRASQSTLTLAGFLFFTPLYIGINAGCAMVSLVFMQTRWLRLLAYASTLPTALVLAATVFFVLAILKQASF